MHAITFDTLGEPDVLRVHDVATAAPGTGELRIKVEFIAVNRPDILFRTGLYPIQPTLPGSRIGVEAVGTVDAVGPAVSAFSVGDRVIAGPISAQSTHGVYGDLAIVPAAEVIPAFDALDSAHNAAAWMAYVTAYGGMVHSGGLSAGDHVLITAASSNVGLAALQIANSLGAIPIATTRSKAKREQLLDAGAKHVIVTDDEDIAETTWQLTGGRGAELVFDATTGPTLPRTAAAAALDGTVVVYGWFDSQISLLPMRWPMKLIGHVDFTTTTDPEKAVEVYAFLRDGFTSGALIPRIDRTFQGLGEIVEAHHYVESGKGFGKVLVGLNP
jgi:NADPH:quinone reductase-like Zn-dependent oxidoreductase